MVSSGSQPSKATSINRFPVCSSPVAVVEGCSPESRGRLDDVPEVRDTTAGLGPESPHPLKTLGAEDSPSHVEVAVAAGVSSEDLGGPLRQSSFLTSRSMHDTSEPIDVSSSEQHTRGSEDNAEGSSCVTEFFVREATNDSGGDTKSTDVGKRGSDIGCSSHAQAQPSSPEGEELTKDACPRLPTEISLLPTTGSDRKPGINIEVIEPAPTVSKAVEPVETPNSEAHVVITSASPSSPRVDNRNAECPQSISSTVGTSSSTVDSKRDGDVLGKLSGAIATTQPTPRTAGGAAYIEPLTPQTASPAVSLLRGLNGGGRARESADASKAGSCSSSNNDSTDGAVTAAAVADTTAGGTATFASPFHSHNAPCTSAEAASGSSSSSFSADESETEVIEEKRWGEGRKTLSGAHETVAASNTIASSCKVRVIRRQLQR